MRVRTLPVLCLVATVRAASVPLIVDAVPQLPTALASVLQSRGLTSCTPIQAAALPRAAAGESLLLHAATGSGKTLAMLLPALARAEVGGGSILVMSPTRELGAQLVDEIRALLPESASDIKLLAQGHALSAEDLCTSRVVVATPAEYCVALACGGDDKAAGALATRIGAATSTVVLDEIDALIPGQKVRTSPYLSQYSPATST